MKLLLDFLPGVFFLGALFIFDIYVATVVVMVAMAAQVALMLLMRKKVGGLQWFTLGVILLFGSATLLLHDATFIKWKPTVINWMFATALLLGPPLLKKNFIQLLMQEQLELPAPLWGKLNLAWVGFLVAVGFLNLWVAFTFTEKVWGLFKVFGITGLLVAFAVAQVLVLSQYQRQDKASES